ncbi:MAG: flagellar basal-body rod protein FlgG [Beijerinckiaceae bacterium]|nr:flagellar basal-body rod protein FlgG [Beijerinckiaceae bacterium]
MRALAIAATGMSAQQLNVEVIANNMANINTTAFKRARAEFTDLLYQSERVAGVSSRGNDAPVPEGSQIGLGVRPTSVRNLHLQGSLAATGNPLDLALTGKGWFQVTTPEGEAVFTRAGSFNTNAQGQLVTADGYSVNPAIQIPQGALDINVNQTGLVTVKPPGQTIPQTVGQITLASFVNESGLEPLGGNLYRMTQASGPAVIGTPGENSYASIRQGYLESSNVDPIKEITELIAAQRAYEMNSKIIQAADEMAGVVAKGIR